MKRSRFEVATQNGPPDGRVIRRARTARPTYSSILSGLVVGDVEDHVHALVRLRATCIPARVVGVMKVFSSREAALRSGIERFHWQAG